MTTILVVDDDPVSCELMADVLKEGGTEVVTETNPERALELASERRFDVALFDIRMPAMDGITLLQRFHESQPEIPIIIMTGFGSVESAVEALGAGAADYLSKPADVEEIRAAVTRALGRRNEETAELPTSAEGPGQYTLSLHVALPIGRASCRERV